MTSSLLDRSLYTMSQVDSLLHLTAGTARRWIDGYVRQGRQYEPVIRSQPTGDDMVTWGEFVEARFLAGYRDAGVSMLRMRPAVERMRQEFGVDYPLAHVRPLVANRELVFAIQDRVGLDRALRLVVARNDQLVLTPPAELFLGEVRWDDAQDGIVTQVLPRGQGSAVVIDPLRQFGQPVVRSVPTAIIAEQFRAGESTERIAELYELPVGDVEDALRFEMQPEAA